MTDSAYRHGSSFLYWLDVRVKLLLLIPLVASILSSSTLIRPVISAVLLLLLTSTVDGGGRELWRVIKMLRWFLMFTLVLHLAFTPGRTLFGLAWLSYDGLIRGILIDLQLMLAVGYSLLLSWTTEPPLLARGFEFLLAPLKIFKVPVRETSGLLLLVLHFFPLIKIEINKEREKFGQQPMKGLGTLKLWAARFEPVLIRLFDRADRLALDIASGKEQVGQNDNLSFHKVSLLSVCSLCVGLAGICLLWQV